MTLFDFQLLPEGEKLGVLYEEGVYIGKRKAGKLAALMFQLDSFYVEVFYRHYRRHVERIRCSACTAFLEPYLEQIDVMHLVS
jgi:hypothetical protein